MLRIWPKKRRVQEIEPDEIFLDSSNMPQFDTEHFEGRMEQPLGLRGLWLATACVILLFSFYGMRAFNLMVVHGSTYAKQAAENQLSESLVLAERGIIYDRTGLELAFNAPQATSSVIRERRYAPLRGIAHVVGYVKPPAKDASGFYYRESFEGIDGAELVFDKELRGENGRVLTEMNARGEIVSQSSVDLPQNGSAMHLSVDAGVSQAFYDAIAARASASNFQGGAGVIMNVKTGEIIALVSYPEYSPQDVSLGKRDVLVALNEDERLPFLDRAVDGLYAPGSIVKPIVAAAALEEGIIDEHTEILSTGALSIPNPYDRTKPTIFRDWKAHGNTDMREAIAVSSDVYFYVVGGGFEGQRGLGIANLEKYFRLFGYGSDAGLRGFSSKTGSIPSVAWKEENFPGDPWRVGNTYHTAIGQYGLQITPLQAARAVSALANGGRLMRPTLIASSTLASQSIPVGESALQVVREGMRKAVEGGTAAAVNLPFVQVAAKTGTAQVGSQNEYMHSWMVGFFPYENPKYAFAVVLERAPAGTLMGAPAAMSQFFWWLNENAAQYLQ